MKLKYLAIALLGASSLAHATSFAIWQQSGSAIADYAAGAAASTTNPDIAYYNPAAMSFFDGQKLGLSAMYVKSIIQYKGTTSIYEPDFGNVTVNTGPGIANGGTSSVGGTLMYVAPISDRWAFGLAIASPFGSYSNFQSNSIVRYDTTKNNIFSVDTSPSLSYKITPNFSIAAGVDYLYVSALIDQMDLSNYPPPQDTTSNNYASTHAWGWHGGLFWKPTHSTNVGLSFRSQFHVRAAGPSQLGGGGAIPAPVSSRINAGVTLPSLTTLSVQQTLSPRWTVMGTTTYTLWSSFNSFVLNNVAGYPNNTTIILPQHYRNTWQFIGGAHFHATQKITLLGGLGFDQSPIRSQYRRASTPDNNHIITSLGIGYQFTKDMGLTAGWSHYFIRQASISSTQNYGGDYVTDTGRVDASANALGLQFDWKMT